MSFLPAPWLPTPPTHLDECGFSKSLVVRLPYISIFWQSWVFFVLRLVVILWLCEEAKCVCLRLHLVQKYKELSKWKKDLSILIITGAWKWRNDCFVQFVLECNFFS